MRRILTIGNKLSSGSECGFTLLEIMAVLMLITLVIGLVLPELFRSSHQMETRIVFRQIGHDIAQMSHEAKGTGVTSKLVFTPGSDEYQSMMGKQVLHRPLDGLKYAGEESLELSFGPQGLMDGPTEIVFKDADGHQLNYIITSAKGR